jgi:BirA family transcriptional regulator, biotin operon repressor / biotin---[acetyl-CoA-carboxylase] ligase
MIAPRETWLLDTVAIGAKVLVYDRVDSTNSLAAALAQDPKREQLAILAAGQTAGRGQHGRTWTAAPGTSVLLSLLLFPPPELRRPAVVTAWAAVSVCTTINRLTGRQASIKWPNDVLVQGKKICGILIEQGIGTVVGIGLNVRQGADEFTAAGLNATSLNQFADEPLETNLVARTLLGVLDEEYAHLISNNLTPLQAAWTSHLGLVGKPVVVECATVVHRGRLCELTFESVKLAQAGEKLLVLLPEQVQHLSLA